VSQLEEELQLIEPREIVGESDSIREMNRMIEAVAEHGHVTVLLTGETGTGKELVARRIHNRGWRRSGPFVPVMLNALPQAMIEAELFGYEAGAFTDARERHIGYLERAHGGVLFLDEVAEIDAHIQVKLLRVFEEREFQRLGSTVPVKVDVQIVTATNVGLEDLVRAGKFREDLYFRLNVHEIVVPALRDRAGDIPLLVDHFLKLFRRQGKNVSSISAESLKALQSYNWRGNVRQLKNVLESAALRAQMSGRQQGTASDLPAEMRSDKPLASSTPVTDAQANGFTIHEALARAELSHIEQALDASHGQKAEAGRLLGYTDRFTMQRRVRRILKNYPHLGNEFSRLKVIFKG
jgi:DNA-binding NtrC family response regulator